MQKIEKNFQYNQINRIGPGWAWCRQELGYRSHWLLFESVNIYFILIETKFLN